MKKFISILVVILLFVSISGCTKTESDVAAPDNTVKQEETINTPEPDMIVETEQNTQDDKHSEDIDNSQAVETPVHEETPEISDETESEPTEPKDSYRYKFFRVYPVYRSDGTRGPSIYDNALNADIIRKNIETENVPLYDRHNPVYKFDTLEEFNEFSNTYGEIMTWNYEPGEKTASDDIIEEYGEDFFEENSLLLIYIYGSKGSARFDLNDVVCENSKMFVNIDLVNSGVTNDTCFWLLTIAFPDDVISNYTEFDADVVTPDWY